MGQGTIAFVPVRYGDGVVGGAETLVRNLAEALHFRGWAVEILTTCVLDHYTWANYFPTGEDNVRGITVRRFPAQGLKVDRKFVKLARSIQEGRGISVRREKYFLSQGAFSPQLNEYLRENRESYRAFIFAPYLFGTTYFGSQAVGDRAMIIPCLHDEPYARLKIIGEMMRRVRGVLFNSYPELLLAKRLYGDDLPGWVVGMGFEDVHGDAWRFRARFGIEGDFILYCGRREIAKNTPLLIHYFCNYLLNTGRDLKLVLTGAGRVDYPQAFRGRIIDLGFISEEDKRDAYHAATLICHPSTNESFSIMILEGWLAKTPCLVHADCAVTRYHVENAQGGLWFGSYPEFHEALELLVKDKELNRKMGECGRSYVLRNYSWDRVVGAFERALEESGL